MKVAKRERERERETLILQLISLSDKQRFELQTVTHSIMIKTSKCSPHMLEMRPQYVSHFIAVQGFANSSFGLHSILGDKGDIL